MLCPNTQAVTNGYAAGSVGVQDHLFQSVSKFGLGDRKKCIRKELEGSQSHFLPRSPEIWICGWGKMEKKVYEKKGK